MAGYRNKKPLPKGSNTGTRMGAIEKSPERLKREKRIRERQERNWAKRSGPITITYIDPPVED